MQPFLERLTQPTPILLDGATGTELNRRGVETSLPLWSARAVWDAPNIVRQIHHDYVEAGAEIITANTFRTHARNLGKAGMRHHAAKLTQLAVDIAREAAEDRAYVAGSLAPLEDCYSPQFVPDDTTLEREHTAMAQNLAAAGVDLILVETQNTVREALAATRAATATGLPACVSFVCGTDGRLLSTETITEAVAAIRPCRPQAFLINCAPAISLERPLSELKRAAGDLPIGAYGNIGLLDSEKGWIETDVKHPQQYAAYAERWLKLGATIIGGCCGTMPEHIRELKHRVCSMNTRYP